MPYEKVWFQLPNAKWTFFDCHLSFFTGKRRCECRAFVNCAMVLKKYLNFFYFQWSKVYQVRNEYLHSYLNWWHNWQLKNRRRSHTLKGSHSIGDGRIFLKNRRNASFNKDLSNEPRMSLISTGSISLDSTFQYQCFCTVESQQTFFVIAQFWKLFSDTCVN